MPLFRLKCSFRFPAPSNRGVRWVWWMCYINGYAVVLLFDIAFLIVYIAFRMTAACYDFF